MFLGLGNKKFPFHLLVVHGSIKATYKGPINRTDLMAWLTSQPDGAVEGIVWHCHDGTLFKVSLTLQLSRDFFRIG